MLKRKGAAKFTEGANKALSNELSWDDNRDFQLASRGFIASLNNPVIADASGRPAWDLNAYYFLEEEASPPSVNPSLWGNPD